MSVALYASLIDLSRIRSFVNGHDEAQVQRILEAASLAWPFQKNPTGVEKAKSGLSSLSKGEFQKLDLESALLAMRAVCQADGRWLENDLFCGVSSFLIDELGSGAGLLLERGSPVELGVLHNLANVNGDVCMGFLTREEIPSHLAALQELMESSSDEADPEILESMELVISWYEHAVDEKLDLVGFKW